MNRLETIFRHVRRYEWPGLAGLGVWIAVVLIYLVLLAPSQWSAAEQDRKWQVSRSEVAELEALLRTVDDLAIFHARFLEKKDFSTIVSTLSQLARADSLSIPSVSYKPDRDEREGYTKLLMTFSVSGNYRNIRRFIADVESSKYFLIIEDMSLNSMGSGSTLDLRIQMSTYFHSGQS